MSKFAHCHYANGFVWCQHHNGSWAPPFPATSDKVEEGEIETATPLTEEAVSEDKQED